MTKDLIEKTPSPKERKPVPIRRKGCKNAGWIWNVGHYEDGSEYREKVVVPLHKDKPVVFVSKRYMLNRFSSDKKE